MNRTPEAGGAPSPAQDGRPRTETVASFDGVRIVHECLGAGRATLVFVHGWSCDRGYWAGQVKPLSREFQVVTIDLGGHGESGLGREAWNIASFGGDVEAVVDRLGLQRPILIGHSMGGDVIVEAARRTRGRVAGLVWIDTYRRLGTPRTDEQLRAFLEPFRADFAAATRAFVRAMFPGDCGPALADRVAEDMASAPPEVALAALESSMSYDREVTGALRELHLPVIAINPGSSPTDVESLRQYGVDVVFLPGVGHFPMLEDPERFNALLREVIERLLP